MAKKEKKKLIRKPESNTQRPSLADRGANRLTSHYVNTINAANKYHLPTTGMFGLTGYAIKHPIRSQNGEPSGPMVAPYMYGRVLELGIGTSLLMNYAPVVNASLGGTLYHGTQMANMPSIMRHGIQTRYAGQSKRLNSVMLTSRVAENLSTALGRPLKKKEMDALADAYVAFEPNKGKGVLDSLLSTAKNIAKKEKVNKLKIRDIGAGLDRFGKRVYFGYAPHTVTDWSRIGNEKQILTRKTDLLKNAPKKKTVLSLFGNIGDVLTGGLGSNVHELYTSLSRKSEWDKLPTKVMTPRQADRYLKKKYIGGRFFNKKNPYEHIVTLGVAPKAKELRGIGAFADFPLVGSVLASNTGLRNIVSKVVPNYSPGRDISIPHDINPKSIRSITISTNPRFSSAGGEPKAIERILIKSEKKSDSLLKRLGTVHRGAALATLGGALMVGDAFFGSKWLPKLFHKNRKKDQTLPPPIIKTSALAPEAAKAIKNGLGWGALAAGGVALLGAPYVLAQHLSQKDGDASTAITSGVSSEAMHQVNNLAGKALAANSGRAVAPLALGKSIANEGAVLGSAAGNVVGAAASMQYDPLKAMSLRLSGLGAYPGGALVPKSIDSKVRNNAELITLGSAALGAGTAVGAGKYVYDRFYSMPYRTTVRSGVLDDISNHIGGQNFKTSAKRSLIPYILLAAGGGLGAYLLANWMHKRNSNKNEGVEK